MCAGHNRERGKMTKEKKETDDLIDALLEEHGISQEAVLGENGLIAQLKKRVVERALAGELTHHLGYAKGEAPEEVDNHRYSAKNWLSSTAAVTALKILPPWLPSSGRGEPRSCRARWLGVGSSCVVRMEWANVGPFR